MLPTRITLLALFAATLARPAAAQVQTYFDVDGNYHQQQYNLLKPAGYRMIALSIYGDLNSPSYAATWVLRPGPDQAAFHGLTAAQYQAWYAAWSAAGYRPRILTAMGTGPNPRFAGVYELAPTEPDWTLHGLTPTQYNDQRALAQAQGFDVTAVDVYGAANDPRYIVSFGSVDAGQHEILSDDGSTYAEHFGALVEGHARPVLVGSDAHGRYVSVWQSNPRSGWVAHHGLTAGQYQTLTNQYWNQGKYPISLQGSGNGSARRFCAVWAPSDLPEQPVFTATGQAVGPLTAFDTWVQNWMQQTETRAAALAIVKDARLVFARGYTNAPAWYPVTQPTSLFEIASNSKPITAMAMAQHFDRPQFNMAATDPMLSHVPFAQPSDARVQQITLASLLTHQGGWDRNAPNTGFDPMFRDSTIATALGIALPIQKADIYAYMIGSQSLDLVPNTQYEYSNFGYCVLGLALEANNPGLSYGRVIERDILTPLGLARPKLARSRRSQLWPGEVTYHPYTPALSRTVLDTSGDWVAWQYGGANKENMDSHGGWVMAAPDYAKILAAFDIGASNPLMSPQAVDDMWAVEPGYATVTRGGRVINVPDGQGGTVRMHYHGGKLAGAVSFVAKREDGLSFVFFTNGDKLDLRGDLHGGIFSAMANQVTAWPNHDLFYSVGIPPFVRVNGSLSPYGQGCPGTAGQPQFSLNNVPDVGDVAEFVIASAPPGSPALVALGLQQVNVSLAPLGAPLCTLLVAPITSFGGVLGATGSGRIEWTTPANPAAIGVTVHSQGAVLDLAANALGLITTRAISVTLGGWQ